VPDRDGRRGAMRILVVGAGTSGAVIAARATENPALEVVLVEAGPDYPGALPPDLDNGKTNSMRKHDWGYRHAPNPHSPRFLYPRGRVVGGSSAVNTCIALRGQAWEYDEWAALGLPEWRYSECLPAFLRLEKDLDFGHEAYHGDSGPLPIRRHAEHELLPWNAALVEAATSLGHARCDDHNAPAPLGVGPQPMNKVEGRRISVARAYLTAKVRARDNLSLLADTLVRRVLFDAKKRARGVEVETHGRVREILADHVVLCGGAIHTPGILLRSGIGADRDVRALGVTPVAEVPAVAAKLLDHPGLALFFWPRKRFVSKDDPVIQVMLRVTSEGSTNPGDLQLQGGSGMPTPFFHLPVVTLMAHVGKPEGHGSLRFESASPHAAPTIVSNLLQNARDRAKAVECARHLRDLAARAPMAALAEPLWPRPKVLATDAGLSRYVSRLNDSGYHPCGTVPMGPEGAASAAVDGRGRVRGVSGLTVADASIMPTIPAVNTNLPTLMIGERFGQWLKDGALPA